MVNDSLNESYMRITVPYIAYMCPRWLTADKYPLSTIKSYQNAYSYFELCYILKKIL